MSFRADALEIAEADISKEAARHGVSFKYRYHLVESTIRFHL